jgi:hypothetical protein
VGSEGKISSALRPHGWIRLAVQHTWVEDVSRYNPTWRAATVRRGPGSHGARAVTTRHGADACSGAGLHVTGGLGPFEPSGLVLLIRAGPNSTANNSLEIFKLLHACKIQKLHFLFPKISKFSKW